MICRIRMIQSNEPFYISSEITRVDHRLQSTRTRHPPGTTDQWIGPAINHSSACFTRIGGLKKAGLLAKHRQQPINRFIQISRLC